MNGYGYAIGDGLCVDGQLILERRRCCGGRECWRVVSLEEEEVGASGNRVEERIPEFGVVNSEGVELVLKVGESEYLCDCIGEGEWISVDELSYLVGVRPFE